MRKKERSVSFLRRRNGSKSVTYPHADAAGVGKRLILNIEKFVAVEKTVNS
jgi:hypothetical protein